MRTRNGKIARLPHSIREQVNQRLDDGVQANLIIDWLNSLPEVQAILQEHFDSQPINPVNMTQWKKGGFLDWQNQQMALQLFESLDDENSFGHKALGGSLTEKLARWAAIQLAANAQAIVANEENPELKWRRLGEFCAQVARLRRDEIASQRLALSRERLELDKLNTDAEQEKTFWKWTERPDIHEKLFPNREKGLSPETLAKIEHELKLL